MTTEWDDQAKRDWLRWEIDTLQQEWDRQQQVHDAREHTSPNATTHVDADTLAHDVTRVKGRGVRYATGVTAPDGYAETVSTWLCWLCDREAEYAGYCEEHYALWREEYSLEQLLEHDEWVEDAYSREQLERIEQEREEDRCDH